MNQALLTAFDEGLGALLTAFNAEKAKEVFKVPDHFMPLYAMLVGYPAESWEAGGQRPRPAFESLYFEGEYGVPMERDPAVVEQLKQDKMIQEPAPLPWRKDEVRALSRMFGCRVRDGVQDGRAGSPSWNPQERGIVRTFHVLLSPPIFASSSTVSNRFPSWCRPAP